MMCQHQPIVWSVPYPCWISSCTAAVCVCVWCFDSIRFDSRDPSSLFFPLSLPPFLFVPTGQHEEKTEKGVQEKKNNQDDSTLDFREYYEINRPRVCVCLSDRKCADEF
mmetsp:Transcript_13661/g.15322  ORF Transcript_13661/g.15322 Transcript_13661/m.15322 type:complete len:109 (-) Transcript_13661:99-425(-)